MDDGSIVADNMNELMNNTAQMNSIVEMINNITEEFNDLNKAFSYDASTTPEGAIIAIKVDLGVVR